ncbi:hypothetical protein HAX54_004333, partial [Datura stramonium]|nr:hypothetical protein [Datura stramonium]
MFEIDLGMTTFGDSPVGSGETLMKRRSNLQLASSHCLDPMLHRESAVDRGFLLRLTGASPIFL